MVTSDRHFRRVPHELPGEVQIWLVDLDAYAAAVALAGLAEQEYARAARMTFERDAERFLASRHALRHALAAALARPPDALAIESDEFGKPRLGDDAVRFSLSRSAETALIGVSRDQAIGVDIERVRPLPDAPALARDHFTLAERAGWTHMADALRDQSFLACWTRKEACVKALGVGLAMPLASIDAGVAQGPGARAVTIPLAEQRCTVTIQSLGLPSEAVGAVALAAPEAVERARRFVRPRPGSP
jgi:4'-phosphopantetheinyl transferase